jgi:hypothetical protein
MTVLAKPSANQTRGWLAAMLAASLCAIMITGCGGSGGAAPASDTGSRDRGQPPSASPAPSACSQWTGLDDLFNLVTWLRQMIGDVVIFGAGTAQAKRDGLAVVSYGESLDGLWENLPPPYTRDLRSSVLPVAASPYKQTPEQLNTAANEAQSLATEISQLCF